MLHWIQGFTIPLVSTPSQTTVPFGPSLNIQQEQEMSKAIWELLNKGVVKKCTSQPGQFLSHYFLCTKPNGDKRFILNLKKFNTFVHVPHFKLEDVRTALKLLQPNFFMATVDLKDAYYTVPISKEHRKFLRFKFRSDIFEFGVLPFGLSAAPYVFTKITKPIVTYLRKRGIFVVVYIDDFLIIAKDAQECANNVKITVQLLEQLGFHINYHKSSLTPKQNCRFLGFILDTKHMSINLPVEKRKNIYSNIVKFKKLNACEIRDFAKFLGTLVAACPAIKYGFLYTKLLEREKYLSLKKENQNYKAIMILSVNVKADLTWWENHILKSSNNIRQDSYNLEIYSDASLSGWGVACNDQQTHGFWNEEEKTHHINFLELKSILYGLQCFAKNYTTCNILIRTDNTTALSYINRMGSIQFPLLNNLTREIWKWCEQRDIWLYASYIPSKDNYVADKQSRIQPSETEWELNPKYYQKILQLFKTPEIDLFATSLNKKCSIYISWKPDPHAITTNAFSTCWSNYFFYAFPPFALILRVLNKIIADKAEGIVLVPNWEGQPWFPLYQKLLIGKVLILGPAEDLLISPFRYHPLPQNLSLVAGILSGKRS